MSKRQVTNVNSLPDATPDSIPAQAAAIDDQLHNLKEKTRPAVRLGRRADEYGNELNPARGETPPSNEFPVKLSAVDPYDRIVDMKQGMIDRRTGATPFGLATITPDDYAWLDRKRQNLMYANFQDFLANRFDMRDPAMAGRASYVNRLKSRMIVAK